MGGSIFMNRVMNFRCERLWANVHIVVLQTIYNTESASLNCLLQNCMQYLIALE